MPAQATIKLRRGTASAWTSANPTLAAGEPGIETDTGKIKYGDGSTAWNSLLYAQVSGLDGWNSVSGTFTYSSADSPVFVATTPSDLRSIISVGTKLKLTQTTVKYFIVVAIDATTITLYGGTDYTLANAAISLVSYSLMQSPVGFPMDPAKWTVEVTSTSNLQQTSAAAGTIYNLGSLSIDIPIGCWRVYYEVVYSTARASATSQDGYVGLSSANNTFSDAQLKGYIWTAAAGASGSVVQTVHRERTLTLAAKTTYYLNANSPSGTSTLTFLGANATTVIRAVCAYLDGGSSAGGSTVTPAAFFRRNSTGDYTLNSTSFANVDTGSDLVLNAVAGDIIEINIAGRYGNEAVNAFLDVATIVSSSPVNYVSGGTGAVGDFGIGGWSLVTGVTGGVGGSVMYTVQSGDISGGTVRLRLRYRTASAANKTLRAGTAQNDAFFFSAKNLGH